ncbi:MAG: putative hydro-lyase [Actinomycetes bacterium]
MSPADARALFAAGLRVPTAGWCRGWTQANLLAVPRDLAYDVLLFGQRNAQACPVLDVSDPGATATLALDGDLRTDLPAYTVYRDGEPAGVVPDVATAWRRDLVAFLFGCSFTFEGALVRAGVPLRHVEAGSNVPMYATDRPCRPAGALHGPLVVSMRPVPAALVPTAVRVTSRYPSMHGAPVHIGDPAGLGIADLDAPDFGDPVDVRPGELPVFWACGVTPQAAVMASRPEFAIGHAPGHMAITDLPEEQFTIP